MHPVWLDVLAKISLTLAVISAVLIGLDVVRRPQKMGVMNLVWPLTGFYAGPLALWAYWSIGREATKQNTDPAMSGEHAMHDANGMSGDMQMPESHMAHDKKPFWQSTLVGVTHCGAGCTLGDFIGEWAIFLLGWTIAGLALWPELIADFALAFLIGVAFQYFAIVPMRKLPPAQGIWAAIKADTLSITAYEVGMFVWMALMRFVFFPDHPLHPDEAAYWFMMQIAMLVGFATSYPMNWWLIKRGWKEKM